LAIIVGLLVNKINFSN